MFDSNLSKIYFYSFRVKKIKHTFVFVFTFFPKAWFHSFIYLKSFCCVLAHPRQENVPFRSCTLNLRQENVSFRLLQTQPASVPTACERNYRGQPDAGNAQLPRGGHIGAQDASVRKDRGRRRKVMETPRPLALMYSPYYTVLRRRRIDSATHFGVLTWVLAFALVVAHWQWLSLEGD